VARLVHRKSTRQLEVVRVPSDAPRPRPPEAVGVVPACGRALRSCVTYVGHGLQLLGQHFSAGAWCADHDEPPADDRAGGG
jgi:hypothetical protein